MEQVQCPFCPHRDPNEPVHCIEFAVKEAYGILQPFVPCRLISLLEKCQAREFVYKGRRIPDYIGIKLLDLVQLLKEPPWPPDLQTTAIQVFGIIHMVEREGLSPRILVRLFHEFSGPFEGPLSLLEITGSRKNEGQIGIVAMSLAFTKKSYGLPL